MAITITEIASQRAEVHQNSTGAVTLAYPGAVVCGNFLIVAGVVNSSGIPPGITDTLGNAWNVLTASHSGGGLLAFIGYCVSIASGANTVSIDVSGATNYKYSYNITEFNGPMGLSVYGAGVEGTGTTAGLDITTANSGELIIGVIGHKTPGTVTITPTSGTQIGENQDNTSFQAQNAQFEIAGAAGVYDVGWTFGSAVDWCLLRLAFKAGISQAFNTNTTWNWPAGVTQAIVESLGGGGGGGTASGNPATGGGGKGGSYARKVVNKGAESLLTIVTGAAGAIAGAGGLSSIDQAGTIVCRGAGGGGGATQATSSANGTGSSTLNGTNTGAVTFAGGNGGTGNFTSGVQGSGAGGGAAGPASVGGNASVNTAGTKGTGTFWDGIVYQNDGRAGAGNNSSGITGIVSGGSGSGGKANTGTDQNGGGGSLGINVITWLDPPLPTFDQNAFRFYQDNATTETNATALAAQNTNITVDVAGGNTNVSFRARLDDTSTRGLGLTTDDYYLYVSRNGGAYVNAETAGYTSVVVPTGLTGGNATTNQLGAGTGTFRAGEITGAANVVDMPFSGVGGFTEVLFGIQLVAASLSHNDTLDFRVYRNLAVISAYTQTARITVAKAAAPTFDQDAFRFYKNDATTETDATPLASQNENIGVSETVLNSAIVLRARLQDTSGVGSGDATDDYQLYVSKNGAAYIDAATAPFMGVVNTPSGLTGGGATTNQLGAGTGTFRAGEISGAGGVVDYQFSGAGGFTELVYGMQLLSLTLIIGDTLDFRIRKNGAVLSAYSITPRMIISKAITQYFVGTQQAIPRSNFY